MIVIEGSIRGVEGDDYLISISPSKYGPEKDILLPVELSKDFIPILYPISIVIGPDGVKIVEKDLDKILDDDWRNKKKYTIPTTWAHW